MESSLTASDFNSFYGDVMQALPDSSHDQTCDKKIVDTYYLDNCQTMEVHEHLIFGNSEVLCASLASLYIDIIDSICTETIYDWRYHPSDKEIYTGS